MVRSGLPLTHEDSIFIAFGQIKGLFQVLPRIKNPYGKCGTELAFEANRIREKFSQPFGAVVIESAVTLPDSIKSPSGRFTIHFALTGKDSTTYEYVDSIAKYEDEAYDLEIIQMGYPKPPFGALDSTWHIYLADLGTSGVYGFTQQADSNPFAVSPSGLPRFRAFTTIDNDFAEPSYPTHGFDAARITVFHEFHHIIQFGSYGWGANDINFREMTSVWMEMRSTPEVGDYLQYIDQYLQHIDQVFKFIPGNGYDQCIWMQFLEKKFGEDIVRNVWQYYSDNNSDFLVSFDSVLTARGTNFCMEYERFGTALYYTGRNFQGSSLFPDARKFDQDALRRTLLQANVPTSFAALPASLNIFICGYGKDTSVIVISRSSDESFTANATLTSKSVLDFQDSFQFPETFCDSSSTPVFIATRIFPDPFVLSGSSDQTLLNILASTNSYPPLSISLTIYSASNSLIRHLERARISSQVLAADPIAGSWYVEWDGRDDLGRLVPSGVYFYSIETDGVRDNGKFVVIRKN